MLQVILFVIGLATTVHSQAQAPQMPDPRQMSGIPRVDPGLAAGTITVRCLLGGFSEPAVNVSVELQIFTEPELAVNTESSGDTEDSKDGRVRRREQTDTQGRATFSGLEKFYGKSAIASMRLPDGEEIRSQPLPIHPQAGTRLLLVKGASKRPADSSSGAAMPSTSPAGTTVPGPMPGQTSPGQVPPGLSPHGASPHGASDSSAAAPALCKPNDLPNQPPGTLMVGVFEFSQQGSLNVREQVEVELRVTPPGLSAEAASGNGRDRGKVEILRAKTDKQGRARFEGLDQFPKGSQFLASTSSDGANVPLPPVRRPRIDPSTGAGTLKVRVFQPGKKRLQSKSFAWPGHASVVLLTRTCASVEELPVADQLVQVHQFDMTGEQQVFRQKSDGEGQVLFKQLPRMSGVLYAVRVEFEGGPFASTMFELPSSTGAQADIRVFPITDDAEVVRSAVQLELHPRENDLVQVNHYYEIFVSGDKAFWPKSGLKLFAADGARSLNIASISSAYLEHKEGAPFAELSRPIPPGESIQLSMAYLVPHRGDAMLAWRAPFPLLRGLAAISPSFNIIGGVQGEAHRSPHEENGGAADSNLDIYEMKLQPFQKGMCAQIVSAGVECPSLLQSSEGNPISLHVSGLPKRNRANLAVGITLFGVVFLGTIIASVTQRSVGSREALVRRKVFLQKQLRQLKANQGDPRYKSVLTELNHLYFQLDDNDPVAGSRPARS